MDDVKQEDPLALLEKQEAEGPSEAEPVDNAQPVGEESEDADAKRERLSRAQRLKLARDRERAARLQAEERLRQLEQELAALKQQTATAQKEGIDFYKQTLEQQLAALREQYAQAFATGDALKAAEIQEKMAEVAAERRLLMRASPTSEAPRTTSPQVEQPKPKVDPVAQALAREWADKNKDWFFSNDVMNLYARYVDGLLVQNGSNPADPEHWEKIDTIMRQKFPEAFKKRASVQPVVKADGALAANTGSRTRMAVTAEDRQIAEKLGIPIEEYVKHKAKVEAAMRSDGYVTLED